MPYHDLELLAVAGSEVSVRCSDKLAIIMEKLADPRADTQEYLEKHMINELLEGLLAELIYNKPANPKQYIVTQLEKVKVAGTKPLLDQADLKTMFGMFDVTKRGAVTESQAKNALRTVLGSRSAALEPTTGQNAVSALVNEEEFIRLMTKVLVQATPLCKGEDGTIRC